MKWIIAFLCLLGFAFSACDKTTSKTRFISGSYSGTFQRQGSTGGQVSHVTLIFNDGNWTGTSDIAKYPALCKGTYQIINGNEINFESTCPWTAEFDWTLILDGTYNVKVQNDSLEISRDYYGAFKDRYLLKRE